MLSYLIFPQSKHTLSITLITFNLLTVLIMPVGELPIVSQFTLVLCSLNSL